MRLLIGTPCLGGQLTHTYVSSLVGLVEGLTLERTYFDTIFISGESFIQRGRNAYANYAMTAPADYTHLLFIDADMGFEWSDFTKLRESGRDIISGVCPYKRFPLEGLCFPLNPKDLVPNKAIRVRHSLTAFQLISVAALRRHEKKVERYKGVCSITGKWTDLPNFFRAGIAPDGLLYTEDWGFSRFMTERGEPLWAHTGVLLSHTGPHKFEFPAAPAATKKEQHDRTSNNSRASEETRAEEEAPPGDTGLRW